MNEKQLQAYFELRLLPSYIFKKDDIIIYFEPKESKYYCCAEDDCRYSAREPEPYDNIKHLESLEQLKQELSEGFSDIFVNVATSPVYINDISKSRTFLLDLFREAKLNDANLSNKIIADIINKAIDRISEIIAGKKKLTLKDIIDHVTEYVESNRMCFAFIKALMCDNKLPPDDFETAVNKINELYEGGYKYKLDAHDLSKMNTLSFSKHPDYWNTKDAPVHGKRFTKYHNIAKMTLELAKNFT